MLLSSRWTSAFTRVFLILFFLLSAPFCENLFSLCLYHFISFYVVSLFDIIVVLKYETSLVACSYLLDIILKSLKRCKRSVKDYDTVTDQADRTISLKDTVLYISTCDRADA